MKVRIVQVEGSPDELREADWVALLSEGSNVSSDQGSPSLPPVVQELLRKRAGSRYEPLAAFLQELASWDDTMEDVGGEHRDGDSNYIRVHRVPRRVGGFVYVRPRTGKATFRLDSAHAQGRTFARSRELKSDSKYRVVLFLKSMEQLKEAIELAKLAYDDAE